MFSRQLREPVLMTVGQQVLAEEEGLLAHLADESVDVLVRQLLPDVSRLLLDEAADELFSTPNGAHRDLSDF